MMGEPLDNNEMPERCPTCNLNWQFHPPAKVHGSDMVRCIECKDTFPLSATPAPDGMEVIAYLVKDDPELGDYLTKSRQAAERSDYGHVRLTDADQAQSALAAMRVERDRNATEYETMLNSYADENQRLHDRAEAAEQQVRDMRLGLEPLAALADAVFRIDDGREMYGHRADDDTIWGFNDVDLTYGHLRRARLLLKEGGSED